MIILKNEHVEAHILELGAELISFKYNDDPVEYIWTAEKEVWARHAPILFPIVGKVVNGCYKVDGEIFKLGQHGFARDMVFDVVAHQQDSVTLCLVSNEVSKKLYPYHFELTVIYTLVQNSVRIEYQVKNLEQRTMYFSIGAHPGFNCPLLDGETFNDYYFEFNVKENAKIYNLTPEGLFKREEMLFLDHEAVINLDQELFKQDALVFHHLESNRIRFNSKVSKRGVSMDFAGFPFLGLWSKPTGAPFICIEPWYGHADFYDFEGDFSEKEDNLSLSAGEKFVCAYTIGIHR